MKVAPQAAALAPVGRQESDLLFAYQQGGPVQEEARQIVVRSPEAGSWAAAPGIEERAARVLGSAHQQVARIEVAVDESEGVQAREIACEMREEDPSLVRRQAWESLVQGGSSGHELGAEELETR